jgi:predicted ATP-grasp superfamily ATP-dependent carboligase
MSEKLLILGASVRAAAQSATRAGFLPVGADLFADVDAARCGEVLCVEDYLQGFMHAATQWPEVPWMYTGALENYPAVIEQLSIGRKLWGNDAATVRRVRDIWRLRDVLKDAGLAFPESRPTADDIPRDGTWLRKAARSAGGLQVGIWDTQAARAQIGPCYYQRRIEGQAVAGVFVANGSSAQMLGISTQQVQDAATGDYRYVGSSTVLKQYDEVAEPMQRIGAVLAAQFKLVGLFGVDAVFDGTTLWPIEVNPRYTASVEIHERAAGFHALELHRAGCVEGKLPERSYLSADMHVAKTVYYAEHDLTITAAFSHWAAALNAKKVWPEIADIPAEGTTIRTGQPVTTLLVSGATAEEILEKETQSFKALRAAVG